MDSTPDPKSTKDVLVARADEQLSRVHEQIARADEQLAQVTEQLAKMEHHGTGTRGTAPEPVPEPPPATPALGKPEPGKPAPEKPARRGVIGIGLLSAACIVGIAVAAVVSQSSRGGVRPGVTGRAPQPVSASSLPPENQPLATRPDPSPVQMAAATGVTAQAAPQDATPTAAGAAPNAASAGPTAAAAAPPTAAGNDSGLTQSLQTMARDLTKLQQGIAELKAKQDQMAGDYAKAIEQLKARQEDMTRRLANVSVQSVAPRASPPPARPSPPRRARERERPLAPPVYWDYYDDTW